MEKLNFKDWVMKYFEEECCHFISKYEKVEVGFGPSDLSHYTSEDLDECYKRYLDDTEDFLKYDE